MDTKLRQIYKPIERELLMVEKKLRETIPTDVEIISTMTNYVFDSGGKRLRPALVLLSAKVCNSDSDKRRTVNFATIAELIHTATLIHDDLLDGSTLRRNRETVNSKWGDEASVLLGDQIYLKAMSLLINEDDLKIPRALVDTTTKMFRGEVSQFEKRGKLSITEEDYFNIVKHKSASFISACCKVGTLLDEDGQKLEASLTDYGLELGMAFQIRDDTLDLVGCEERLGKSIGSDLREGRLTLPVIHLLREAQKDDRRYLESALTSLAKGGAFKRRIRKIKQLLERYGSIDYSLNTANNHARRAKEKLRNISNCSAVVSLSLLCDYVVSREH